MTKRELFKVGAITVGVLAMLTSCASPMIDHKAPELQKMIGEALAGSNTVCLDNYGLPDAYGPTYRDVLVGSMILAQKELVSDDQDVRLKAKHALTWNFIAPNGDKTVYEAYFQRIMKANPKEYDKYNDSTQTRKYLEVVDRVASFGESDFSRPERPAEALCEAVFRTIKLIEYPDDDGWKNDVIVFRGQKTQTPGMSFDYKTGRYRPAQAGDTNDVSMNEYKVKVAEH